MTTRAAVLAVIGCALVLALAYPIRAYVAQRGNIRKLEQQRSAAQRRVDVLERQRAQWEDRAYVETQARQRLRYVLPGEKSLLVIGQAPAPAATPSPSSPRAAAPNDPWYERLWTTVEIAGTPSKEGSVRGGRPAKSTPPPTR